MYASPRELRDGVGRFFPWSLWPEPGPASTLRFSFSTFSFIFFADQTVLSWFGLIQTIMTASDAQSGLSHPTPLPPRLADLHEQSPLLYSRFSSTFDFIPVILTLASRPCGNKSLLFKPLSLQPLSQQPQEADPAGPTGQVTPAPGMVGK